MNKNIIFMTISLLCFNVRCPDLFKWCRSNKQKNIVNSNTKDKELNYDLQLFNKKKETLKKTAEEIKKQKKWVIFEIIAKGYNIWDIKKELTNYFDIDFFTAFEKEEENKIKDEIEKEMEHYDEKEKGIFKFIKILEKSNCVLLSEEEAKILIENLSEKNETNKIELQKQKKEEDQYGAQQSFFVLYKDISGYQCKYLSQIHYIGNGVSYSINIVAADTSDVTDMGGIFYWCRKAEKIQGLEKINTSKVINMSHMFSGCLELTELNLSNFDTSNVKDMRYMFSGCSRLRRINLSDWETSNVEHMSSMFNKCEALTEIKGIGNWKIDNVITMDSMFSDCKKLTTFDVSNWEIKQNCNKKAMFNNCAKLKTNINKLKNLLGEK